MVRDAATRLSVRAGPAAAAAIGTGVGVALGTTPCRANASGQRAALWLGPDEWLLIAPPDEGPALIAAAITASADHPASIVDVSHRGVTLEVSGPRATDALNAFCALDLDARAFPLSMCSRTVFGKAEIVLWRTGLDTFRLDVARSFVPYVQACLAEASREFAT
jgi:heterotetrameric sarcosine oxidase gamma subunit